MCSAGSSYIYIYIYILHLHIYIWTPGLQLCQPPSFTIYVSYYYRCVLILLCVLILVYLCPAESSVLSLLHMCPHTIYVSAYCYVCAHTSIYVSCRVGPRVPATPACYVCVRLLHVSSYCYMCVLTLTTLYMCPHTTTYVFILTTCVCSY
jgi:hypothetical protein